MADASDSTPAPEAHRPVSRRGFFGSAVAAGVCTAAGPPIFTVPAVADAAILAMGPFITGLVAIADGVARDLVATEELIDEMTNSAPVEPRDTQGFRTDAAYHEAMRRYEADTATWLRQRSEANAATGLRALEGTQEEAERAVIDACGRLAEVRATTLDGLILKARFAERGNWDALSRAIVADLLSMG